MTGPVVVGQHRRDPDPRMSRFVAVLSVDGDRVTVRGMRVGKDGSIKPSPQRSKVRLATLERWPIVDAKGGDA